MSSARVRASGSHTNPVTQSPVSSSMRPIASGAGIAATKLPKWSSGIDQISISMPGPTTSSTRISPGLGGDVPGSANRR